MVQNIAGPGIGVGAFGDLGDFNAWARLSLVPFMLAGRFSLVPLMIIIVWVLYGKKALGHSLRQRTPRRFSRRLVCGGSLGSQ